MCVGAYSPGSYATLDAQSGLMGVMEFGLCGYAGIQVGRGVIGFGRIGFFWERPFREWERRRRRRRRYGNKILRK